MTAPEKQAISNLRDAYIQLRNLNKESYIKDIEEVKSVFPKLNAKIKQECIEQIEFLDSLINQ